MIECYPGNKLPLFCASLVLVGSDIFNFLYNFAIIITLSNPIRWLFKLAFLFHWLMNLILLLRASKKISENSFSILRCPSCHQIFEEALKHNFPSPSLQAIQPQRRDFVERKYIVTSRCIAASTAMIFITLSE